MLAKFPCGFDELIATFGDPRRYRLPDGTLSPAWERKQIVRVDLPAPLRLDFVEGEDEPTVSQITAHRLVADNISAVLKDIYRAGLWDQLGGYSGGFAWRPIRGKKSISTHAWGIAWDFGGSRDPLGDDKIDMPQAIVKIFESHGFTWGGHFKRKDGMHFQACSGY